MKIAKNKVVGIHYTLTDDKGNTLDSSDGRDPLYYLHGNGNLIPGLERELENKQKDDDLKVTIQPEDAYGVRNDEMVYEIERSKFPDPNNVERGMTFTSHTKEGDINLTVVKIEGDNVTLDANHPLAGQELTFEVKVVDVRDASAEEIDHGHVHEPGAHHH
ncbi:MAG: peptidylprolyl isomerase [Bacteroidales bacterium]|jgi:FKBP-type peptidyl-prolyl cis-trans isomerase SlyD|nr:peptidylprolyl isomerase [Bacteroidales bacterium]NCU36056.1 peptidylprolyl isomerase [Candidatus Falkowbacteria bacterium]MDD2633669.1 peptidylprolyl isomerase [Bacteroidales bacterium]MDD3526315.1 peptidylprolyl isomerase [Bacteroidales bacterium]MDD4177776.1 peptidylprolyl isomerase [Bacteroidales bacterium]